MNYSFDMHSLERVRKPAQVKLELSLLLNLLEFIYICNKTFLVIVLLKFNSVLLEMTDFGQKRISFQCFFFCIIRS